MKHTKYAVLMAAALTLACAGNTFLVNAENTQTSSEEITYQSEPKRLVAEGTGEENCTQQYIIHILDDQNAVLSEILKYDYGMSSTYDFQGIYSKDDAANSISFIFNSDYDQTKYTFSLNGDQLEDANISYGDVQTEEPLEGEYTCTDEALGEMKLTVEVGGKATLVCGDGKVYTGNLFYYNDAWNLCASDDAFENNLDWMVSLEGDQFTWETYMHYLYHDYAGVYTANGDLGEITFNVDSEGIVTLSVMINGEIREMNGSISVDTDNKVITNIYASSLDCYSVDLSIRDLQDGSGLNYSGSYSIPLGAG